MDDQQVTSQDEPVVEPTTTPTETVEAPQESVTQDTQPTVEEPTEAVAEPTVEEEDDYRPINIPDYDKLDFSKLPVGEDNLIDPQALAGAINQQIAAAENRATARAQQAYIEQQQEAKGWEKAIEKYPELKTSKDLKDIVHRARLGEVTDLLSRNADPSTVKLPTPVQIADKIFKYMGNAKAEGMKQATQNTVIQASAHVETASTRSNDGDAKTKAYQNINNPNKEVAKQARNDLLKSMLFGEK